MHISSVESTKGKKIAEGLNVSVCLSGKFEMDWSPDQGALHISTSVICIRLQPSMTRT